MAITNRIAVFARWRPVFESETAASDPELSITTTERQHASRDQPSTLYSIGVENPLTTTPSSTPAPVSAAPWNSPAAFTAVLGPEQDNSAVYNAVVAPATSGVLLGQNFSVFAYGHSGSGKTHTIIGNDSQPGLCVAAANDLFAALEQLNTSNSNVTNKTCSSLITSDAHPEHLGIGLSVFELRRSTALDLLSPTKTECRIRQGPDGRTHIRGATEMLPGGKVRVRPLTQLPCFSFRALEAALRQSLAARSVGRSSIHDASSRTHAVIKLEIVNYALVMAREALWIGSPSLCPWERRQLMSLWKSRVKATCKAKIDRVEASKKEFEDRVAQAEQVIEDILQGGRDAAGVDGDVASESVTTAALGASMVFVDLAGAEYHTENSNKSKVAGMATKQTSQERQEGRQINTDLLALKEVIRAWSNGAVRVPFRSSPLTMVLREHFLGLTGVDQERQRKASSTMVVTVTPSAGQHAATLNSLKYGSLVGATGA